ncbi:PAS domain S-box protein, partial [candidate division GN15 bacterium]|nr:PAS domain S-box protein [candidate division GN15 bacterium]
MCVMSNTVSQKPTTNRLNPDAPRQDSTVNSPQVLRLRRAADIGTAPSIFAIGEFERYVAVVASRLTTSSPERLDSELQGVVATLGRIVSDGSISLHLFDNEQDTVQTTYHFSTSNGSMVWHVPMAIAGYAWSLRDLRWFEKDHMPRAGSVPLALADERRRALDVNDAKSVLNIPLWAGPRQYGALVLTSNSETRRLSEGDVTLLKILGQVLANGLAHVHMERELKERECRFRAIANYTFDWEDWLDPRGNLLYVNPAVERITGYTVPECHAMPEYPLPIVHEQDRPVVAE